MREYTMIHLLQFVVINMLWRILLLSEVLCRACGVLEHGMVLSRWEGRGRVCSSVKNTIYFEFVSRGEPEGDLTQVNINLTTQG